RPRRRLDVPFEETQPECRCDLAGKLGLARAGLALDQQRPLEADRCIDRDHQVLVGHIGLGTGKLHATFSTLWRRGHYARGPRRATGLFPDLPLVMIRALHYIRRRRTALHDRRTFPGALRSRRELSLTGPVGPII